MAIKSKVYKIGEYLQDVNGGMYEYGLISDAVSKSNLTNTLVIVNGKPNITDFETVKCLMNKFKYKIFIATDPCFNDTLDIANDCDIVLTQSWKRLSNIKRNQMYSYVPELFVTDTNLRDINRQHVLLFGGGHISEDKLQKYAIIPNKFYIRTESRDTRVPYEQFRNIRKCYDTHLIISRDIYKEYAWITPRFVEAICDWSYPIVDKDYDIDNYYCFPKVYTEKDILDAYNLCPTDRFNIIAKYRRMLLSKRNNFITLLNNIEKESI